MITAVERFGALGVFLLMIPESACVPIPSEITLLCAGFAVRMGWMSFPLAVLGATAGNLVGSVLAYGLGASHLLERVHGVRILLRRWERLLGGNALRAVFFARLLPVARTFVSLPAGARRVRLVPFVGLTALGCALWSTVFVALGVVAGAGWTELGSALGRALLVLGILVMLASVARRRRGR
jgi:membrane protein DedA with SNARE-associated domain